MSLATELLTALDESVEGLRAALGGAGGAWQQEPAPGEWSPRLVAEHVVLAYAVYGEFLAAALGRRPLDWTARNYAFPTPADARQRLDELHDWLAQATLNLDEIQLSLPVPELGAQAREPTIGGLLRLAARHIADHARQIRAASKGLP